MAISDQEIRNVIASRSDGNGAVLEAIGGLLDRIQELQIRVGDLETRQ
ncbi:MULTISPECIES: hypothetical protein [Microbacterium]|nr:MULTISPECIES: hypothetical protein [Microbacterium]